MRYSRNSKHRYIIMNPEGEIMDGIDDSGAPHFTPIHILEQTNQTAMNFKDRFRLPAQITSKLDDKHGIMEVEINEKNEVTAKEIENGRLLGKIQTIAAPQMLYGKSGNTDTEYMSRANWTKK